MKLINRIKSWPTEKRRIFSISLAVFLTILIIILNSLINLIWKDEPKNNSFDKSNPIESIQESLSKIFADVKPALDTIFSSSTATSTSSELVGQIENTPGQINSTSSSSSTTSNVVE